MSDLRSFHEVVIVQCSWFYHCSAAPAYNGSFRYRLNLEKRDSSSAMFMISSSLHLL